MPTRATLIAGTWLSGGVLAASGVATALIVLGDHAYPSVHVLSQAQVRGQLAAQPGVTVTVTPSGRPMIDSPHQTPMPSAAARPSPRSTAPDLQPAAHVFLGGTVFASCAGDEATVTQRIPAQGYWIDRVWPGPSASVGVRFTSPARDELVTVTCSGGQAAFASRPEPPGGDVHRGPGPGPARPGRDGQPRRDGLPGAPAVPGGGGFGGFGGPGGTGGGDHGGTGGFGGGQHGGTGEIGGQNGGVSGTRGGQHSGHGIGGGRHGTGHADGTDQHGTGRIGGTGHGGTGHIGIGAVGGTGHGGTGIGQNSTGAGISKGLDSPQGPARRRAGHRG